MCPNKYDNCGRGLRRRASTTVTTLQKVTSRQYKPNETSPKADALLPTGSVEVQPGLCNCDATSSNLQRVEASSAMW